ncbi:hypothetical protein OZN62_05235 [Aurantiacibacter sp. MUD11]|uniref:hypothetical protein n=1 Tax=Aurantiacibacter sp. MUD11 TaxID=3003265 RepID=UPI0022AA04AD|nr:hypothetical protein [Aurantiacibacter sp. MUD11]WAT18973.1 hypothetical protein OZN62_05235 [Aurantiacibacter sp. MUD11]
MRSRNEKLGIAISVTAFFGAIAVIGWFGLSGYDDSDDRGSAISIVFSGGSPVDTSTSTTGDAGSTETLGEDEYVVGDFGDPVTELYEEEAGGWGAGTTSGGDLAEDSEPRRAGRIVRGTGGNN